jgi:toxin ParE1/3/4
VKLEWSPIALEQAEEALDYIGDDRPEAAVRWLDGLFERVARLAEFPHQGRVVPEARREDLRELIYGSYRVIYRVREDAIAVILVRHTRMDLSASDLDALP